MKLQAQVGGERLEVEIRRREVEVFALIDDREYELEVSEPEPNVYLLKHNGMVHEFFVNPDSKPGEPVIVSAKGRETEVTLIDPKRLRGVGSGGEHADGYADIKTAMPGKVVRIIAKAGENVSKGDPVLVVEAMKMQNELKSPKAGIVKEIRVVEGETVSGGDVLAIVD